MPDKNTDDIVKGILSFLEKTGQSFLLPKIAEGLKEASAVSDKTAVVNSAFPLTQSEEKQISKLLNVDYGITKTKFSVDESLLGGIKIITGDRVLDLSGKKKLNDLSNIL